MKLFKNRAEAIEILLKLDAGQEMIDDYVTQQEGYLELLKSSKDFIPFGLYNEFYWQGIGALQVWNWFNQVFGDPATETYTSLLIHCAEHDSTGQEMLKAVMGLALLRITKALPTLKELIAREPLLPKKSDSDKDHCEYYRSAIQNAIEFLETPGAWGIYQNSTASFMLLSRTYWNKFRGELLPKRS